MEVTRANFTEAFEYIKACIHSADLISFDTEFSGYSACKQDRGHEYDMLEERYQKLKYACQRFKALQIGICTFTWDDQTQQYIARPFNFYVMNYSKIFDGVYSVRSDCLFFLADHNFNFNKLFKESIPYQRLSERKEILDSLRRKTYLDWAVWSKRDKTCPAKSKQIQNKNQLFEDLTSSLPQSKKEVVKAEASESKEESKCENSSTTLDSAEDLLIDLYNREMGFSMVIDEMIKAKKPLIGHNQIYDIGFLYDQFIAPLPDSFLEFTEKWRECFPDNYDTKVVALNMKLKLFRKTDLESLYKTCRKDATVKEEVPFIIDSHPYFEKYRKQIDFFNNESENNCLHEAGFDAFMTGVIFMCLTKHKELILELKNKSSQAGKNSKNNKERQQKKQAKKLAKMNKSKKNKEDLANPEESSASNATEESSSVKIQSDELNVNVSPTVNEELKTESPSSNISHTTEINSGISSVEEKASVTNEESKIQSSNFKIKIGMNGQDKNLVLLNFKGRYFNFKESFDGIEECMDMTNVIWIRWGNPINGYLDQFDQEEAELKSNIILTTDEVCEAVSIFGDIHIVKDSEVSCFVKYINFDFDNISGSYNKKYPLSDINVLNQIENEMKNLIESKYSTKINESGISSTRIVYFYSEAKLFSAKNNYS